MAKTILRLTKRTLKSSAAPFSWMSKGWRDKDHDGAGNVVIFGYHRIVADISLAEKEAIHGLVTSTETFRRHLEIIREHYDVLTLEEASEVLQGGTARRAVAVITFDDGYRDVYEQALPALREYGLPATVFIVTGCVGTGKLLDHDRLYWYVKTAQKRGLSLHVPLTKAGMDREKATAYCAEVDPQKLCNRLVHLPLSQREEVLHCLEDFLGEIPGHEGYSLLDWGMISELAEAGISFGAHTHNHVVLPLEDEAAAGREIRRSKELLEEHLGRPVRHFAYPTGRYNTAIRNELAREGFELAVTTERRVNRRGNDMLTLGRICLCEESTRGISGRFSEAVARLRLTA